MVVVWPGVIISAGYSACGKYAIGINRFRAGTQPAQPLAIVGWRRHPPCAQLDYGATSEAVAISSAAMGAAVIADFAAIAAIITSMSDAHIGRPKR